MPRKFKSLRWDDKLTERKNRDNHCSCKICKDGARHKGLTHFKDDYDRSSWRPATLTKKAEDDFQRVLRDLVIYDARSGKRIKMKYFDATSAAEAKKIRTMAICTWYGDTEGDSVSVKVQESWFDVADKRSVSLTQCQYKAQHPTMKWENVKKADADAATYFHQYEALIHTDNAMTYQMVFAPLVPLM